MTALIRTLLIAFPLEARPASLPQQAPTDEASLSQIGQGEGNFEIDGSGTKLPFRLSKGYLIMVEGQIGTRTHLNFILDTGASTSIVDSKIADTLKLNRGQIESFNFDRNLTWGQAVVPDVRFGPVTAKNVVMLVGNLAAYSEFARDADAIIGLDLLSSSRFTVDYRTKNLVFHWFDHGTKGTHYEVISNGLVLEIEVQGRPVRLIVDTGFPKILLFQERLQERVPELRTTGEIFYVTIGNRMQAKQAMLPGVSIGPTRRDLSVLLTKAPAPEMLPGIDGVIGIAALHARRVNFDFAAGTLSWE